ncbi:response regulator [Aliisedimentitalea scapharcae]|uniref:histidine kinase n=1 Tax=Aliisedimentitalea scapharcae TaxID=1524259 RepID=A0ABZ2XRP8_9RHOB
MLKNLGLGGKLLLAFILIAGLPTIAGLLGVFELRELARRQAIVINQTIPVIADVRGITEESTRIIAIAPELAEVNTQEDRTERTAFLSEQVDALILRLDRLDARGSTNTTDLRRTVADVADTVQHLNSVVARRIAQFNILKHQITDVLEASNTLLDMADTLVANAEMGTTAVISSLYDAGPGTSVDSNRADTLDKLLEVDLFQLGLMFELRSRTAEIGLLINRIDEATSATELGEIAASLTHRLSIVSRRIKAIPDPGRLKQAQVLLQRLRVATDGAPNLFELRQSILDTNAQIGVVKQELQDAAIRLGGEAGAVADRAQTQAIETGERAAADVQQAQTRNTVVAVVGLIFSLAILWFFIRGNITLRLDHLSNAMTALAKGRLDRRIAATGYDEIARMEQAVEVFRKQAIAKSELEKERDRTERELLEHRNNLQAMVAEQTEKLRHEVEAHDVARREAEAADRAKSEFLAMMSHEIRTPMNGVLGMLRGLTDEPLSSDQQLRLRAAIASGQNLLKILNDILDYSKVESGGLTNDPVAFSVSDLVTDIVVLMRPSADEKGLHLWLDLADDVPHVVRGDVAKLRQILFNLLSNAVKFTDQGEVILRVRANGGGSDACMLTFEVSDTGHGIANEAKRRVFEAFEQEDDTSTRAFGGTGLGLAISRRFAQVIGARLTLESTKAVGSVFSLSINLPIAQARDLVPPEAALAPGLSKTPLRVLVVEDNEINQMVAQGYLERMGHSCQCLANAEDALKLLQEQQFDVVLMDVDLPGMSGTDATRLLRQSSDPYLASVPVIGISAHVLDDQIESHLQAGMHGFVAKPVSPERLSQALDQVAAGHQGRVFLSSRRTVKADQRHLDGLSQVLQTNARDFGAEKTVQIAQLFLDQLGQDHKELLRAVEQADWHQVAKTAHRLKGAVGNFELDYLGDLLAQAERQAKRGTKAEVAGLITEINALVPQIESAMAEAQDRFLKVS